MKRTTAFLFGLVIIVMTFILVACGKNDPSNVNLEINNWGPQSTVAKKIPNPMPDGNAGIWIEVSDTQGLGEAEVLFSGKPAKMTVVQPKLITAAIEAENFNQAGDKEIAIKQVSTGKIFPVGMFYIESVGAELEIGNWGPQSTEVKKTPNPMPDGTAGIWIEVSGAQGLGEVQVLFSGKPAKITVVQPKLITAAIEAEHFNQAGAKEIAIKQVSTGKIFPVGMFHVDSAK